MTLTFGGLDVLCLPIRHTAQSLGYRFTAPITQASIAFSGDADECDALVELARDVDLFVCDAAFPDGQRTEGHLTPSLAAAHAERAGAQRLLSTHFYPECETVDVVGAAAHHCTAPVHAAVDLQRAGDLQRWRIHHTSSSSSSSQWRIGAID